MVHEGLLDLLGPWTNWMPHSSSALYLLCGSSVGSLARTCPFVFLSRQNANREARKKKKKKKTAGENNRSSIFLIKHDEQLSNKYMVDRVFFRDPFFLSRPVPVANCSCKETVRVRRDGVSTGGAIVSKRHHQKWLGYQIVSFLCDGLRCVTSLFCAFPVVWWANAFFFFSHVLSFQTKEGKHKAQDTRHRTQGTRRKAQAMAQVKARQTGRASFVACLFVCLFVFVMFCWCILLVPSPTIDQK